MTKWRRELTIHVTDVIHIGDENLVMQFFLVSN